jgi:AcrR family transcriptional regulator
MANFQVRDIAEVAGVSPALLYHYYPNRERLLSAALYFAAHRAPSAQLLCRDGGPVGYDALRSALVAEFDDAPEIHELNLLWNEMASLPPEPHGTRAELVDVTDDWVAQVADGIARARTDGSISTPLPTEILAIALTAVVDGLSQRWLAGIIDTPTAIAALDSVLHDLLH